jgi:ubiquinone/menaquinone biosynthesis C-methylase UbiE
MGLKSGLLVLEIGPGPGRLLIPASQQVLPDGRVVGLDIQPGMLKRLSARAAQAGVTNLKTILGDAVDSHFSPESFDLIFLCTVLGEIPDRLSALQQCNTALKPNGQLSITEIFPDPHYQSPEIVKKLAETAGFKLKEIVGNWYFYTANFEKARAGELE